MARPNRGPTRRGRKFKGASHRRLTPRVGAKNRTVRNVTSSSKLDAEGIHRGALRFELREDMMTNREIARLLRKAASAVEHGRYATARKAVIESTYRLCFDPVQALMDRCQVSAKPK